MKKQEYSRQRKLKTDEKLGPQALVIFESLPDSGRISREDLIAAITKKLTTKQPAERVFGFYRKKLMDMGVMNEFVEQVQAEGSKEAGKGKSKKGAKGSAKKAA